MPSTSETAKHRPTGRICVSQFLSASCGMPTQPKTFAVVQQAEAKSMWMSTSVAGYGNLYAVRMCLLKRMMVLLKKTHCAMRKTVTRWVPTCNCTMCPCHVGAPRTAMARRVGSEQFTSGEDSVPQAMRGLTLTPRISHVVPRGDVIRDSADFVRW